jgi:hypothetical protein
MQISWQEYFLKVICDLSGHAKFAGRFRSLVNRALFALLAAFVVASALAKSTAAPEVIFVSPCECQGFHGKNRWITKTDLSPVPSDKSAIQSVTPSMI